MSDLIINIRFGKRHLQVTNKYKVTFNKNAYWEYHPYAKWFEIYDFFGV